MMTQRTATTLNVSRANFAAVMADMRAQMKAGNRILTGTLENGIEITMYRDGTAIYMADDLAKLADLRAETEARGMLLDAYSYSADEDPDMDTDEHYLKIQLA